MTKLPVPPGAPDLDAARAAFSDFCVTIAALRDPVAGCPWDLKQDHKTLRRYMIEEAYEASDAMASDDSEEICGELGDVLLQVVLNAQIAQDERRFSITDVVRGIDDKMRRRHPHVFGDAEEKARLSAEQVRGNWDVIKAGEAKARGEAVEKSIMADAEKKQPATLQALKIGKIAKKVRFDWDSPLEVLAQVRSEIDELVAEFQKKQLDREKIAEEIGDVYFSLGQLCRHLDLDPETVSLDANRKFLRRFARLEALAKSEGKSVDAATRDELEEYWKRVKREE